MILARQNLLPGSQQTTEWMPFCEWEKASMTFFGVENPAREVKAVWATSGGPRLASKESPPSLDSAFQDSIGKPTPTTPSTDQVQH